MHVTGVWHCYQTVEARQSHCTQHLETASSGLPGRRVCTPAIELPRGTRVASMRKSAPVLLAFAKRHTASRCVVPRRHAAEVVDHAVQVVPAHELNSCGKSSRNTEAATDESCGWCVDITCSELTKKHGRLLTCQHSVACNQTPTCEAIERRSVQNMRTHSTPSSSRTASLEPYSLSFKPFSGKLTFAVSFSRVNPARTRIQA